MDTEETPIFRVKMTEEQFQTFLEKTPLVVAFGPDGKPVDLLGDIEPEHCDHASATWSSCFDMRCARCGARLFMPPAKLAYRADDVIEAMHAAWVAAGWPSWVNGHWSIIPERWQLTAHPLFAHVGGLPVRAGQVTA